MRIDTLWQGERRAQRMHWWRHVLDGQLSVVSWGEVLDEMVELRFGVGEDASPCHAVLNPKPRARKALGANSWLGETAAS